jgi:hypothetical protein
MVALRADAARRGESHAQAVRHHVLEGLMQRVALVDDGFVLRGGMLTRKWVTPEPRATHDLDYVGDFRFDVAATLARFRPALAVELDDGVVFDPERVIARGIWLDSEFPGVHVDLAAGYAAPTETIGIDIGFNDPLVPPATRWEAARAVRPETQLAWKLHCLAEMGEQYRPKDIADLWLITAHCDLEAAALPPAITAAFESRGFSLADARTVLDREHWATKTARVRWERTSKLGRPLAEVLAGVRERLRPTLEAL